VDAANILIEEVTRSIQTETSLALQPDRTKIVSSILDSYNEREVSKTNPIFLPIEPLKMMETKIDNWSPTIKDYNIK